MKTIIIVATVFIIAVFTGLKEGYRERERQEPLKKWGSRWHLMGFFQRVAISVAFVPFTLPDVWLTLYLFSVSLWFNWVLYDGLTNLPKILPGSFLQRFFYSGTTKTGTTSKIDLLGGEYLPFIKLFYTLAVVILTVMYFTI